MIIYLQKKRSTDALALRLIRDGFRAMSTNGDRPVKRRIKAVDSLRSGELDILVATDVLARGMNMPDVNTIINMDLPLYHCVNYIHRIGRTGRMGNIGRAISFYDVARDYKMSMFLTKVWVIN